MSPWTEERTDELKRRWLAGESALQIAVRLGDTTRNAVMGKLHRLGIPSPKLHPHDGARRPRISIPKPRPKPPVINVGPPVKTENGYITLADLKDGMCKWPIGDPQDDDFHFCGRPSVEHRSYCGGHCAAAYRPNTRGRGVAGGGE